VQSKHENALPLIITHGWPGSLIEFMNPIEGNVAELDRVASA
jgi:hypothetical protein